MAKAETLFKEDMRFPPKVLWLVAALLLLSLVIVGSIFGYGIYQQLVLDRPWGKQPMSDANLVWFTVGLLALLAIMDIPVIILLVNARQRVRISGTHVVVEAPLFHRRIAVDDITAWSFKSCRGFGAQYRLGRGWVINLGGRHCVELRLAGKGRLTIGTNRPEALRTALERVCPLDNPDGGGS